MIEIDGPTILYTDINKIYPTISQALQLYYGVKENRRFSRFHISLIRVENLKGWKNYRKKNSKKG